jgi:hypothetical protein
VNASEKLSAVLKDCREKQHAANKLIDAEYAAAIAPAHRKYVAVRTKADKVYHRISDPAYEVRTATCAPPLKAYTDAREAAKALLTRKKREVSRSYSKLRRFALDAYHEAQEQARARDEKKRKKECLVSAKKVKP